MTPNRGNLLVVDDIPANLRLLASILDKQGYKVRPANNGMMALNAVRASAPDLILLDVKMPQMDGYEVCRRLKADAQTHDIPVIFISVLEETEDKVKGFAAGGVDYVTKPFQPEEVLARVETHLALRDMQARLQEKNAQLQQEIAQRVRAERMLRVQSMAVEYTANGIVITDRAGTIMWVNPAFSDMTGYTAEEAIGRNPRDLVKSGKHDRSFYKNLWDTILAGKVWRGELINRRKDGSLYTEEMAVAPIRDERGEIIRFIAIKQDITERKRAEEELRRLNDELEDQVERRTLALRRRAAELEALARVSSALRQATTLDDMIAILVQETVSVLEAEAGAILLLEDEALVVAGLHGLPRTLLGYRPLPCDGLCWAALKAGQSILTDPVEGGGCATCKLRHALGCGGMTARVIVPLQAAERTLGLLQLGFSQPDRFLEEHRRPLLAIAEIGGNALQRARTMTRLEQLARDRMRDLATLYEVTATTTRYLDIDTILDHVLQTVLEVTGGDAGAIHLLDEDEETLGLVVQHGMLPELINQVQALSAGARRWYQVIERDKTVIETLRVSGAETVTYIGVPIHAAGRVLGVLSVLGEAIPKSLTDDTALLTAIADHTGVVVESAQLRRQAEEAAVMEERQRLARDLHDSVTQSLYSLTLFAEAGQDSARAADLPQVERYLRRLEETTQQALKEMRLLIYELHPPALTQAGLVGALRQRLEAVERRAGVEPQLLVDGPLELPADVEVGLYRIAQEALNNALKHSGATQVTVQLSTDEEGLVLEVVDDGQGFDVESVKDSGGLGLAGMRERATRLGGTVTVHSAPGEGTTVKVQLPVNSEQ